MGGVRSGVCVGERETGVWVCEEWCVCLGGRETGVWVCEEWCVWGRETGVWVCEGEGDGCVGV